MRFHIHRLGCPKNDVDADIWYTQLIGRGFVYMDEPERADLILINTCGFIDDAKEESIDAILALAELKVSNPDIKIVATGCMPVLFGKEMLAEMPELDSVVGNRNLIEEIDNFVDGLSGDRPRLILSDRYGIYPASPSQTEIIQNTFPYANLKISEGCQNHCTYCLLPSIRGPLRSIPSELIVKQAEELLEKGFRELILIAQDTTLYRDGDKGLADLMRELNGLDGDFWIRLMYAHPAHLTGQIIDALAIDKVVPYLDMPIQHISDSILETMNRNTTEMEIRKLIATLKSAIPDIALRTTVMTGFPGETEDDFARLLDFVSEGHFTHLGAFAFSPQDGTPAFDIPGFSPEIAVQRRIEVEEAQNRVARDINMDLLNTEVTILTEYVPGDETTVGRMAQDAPDIDRVIRTDGEFPAGEFIRVILRDEFDGLFEAETARSQTD